MAVVEPDGGGIAAVYLNEAGRHSREALAAFRTRRPIRSNKHTQAALLLRRAAEAEEYDPQPEGLDMKRLPPPSA